MIRQHMYDHEDFSKEIRKNEKTLSLIEDFVQEGKTICQTNKK